MCRADLLGGVVKEVLDGMSERAVNVGVLIHGHERAIDRVIAVVDDSADGKAGLELAARIVQKKKSTLHAVLVPQKGATDPSPALEELLREANTLGSKSTSIEMTAISVDMKVAIEQLREQVQNVE